MSVVHAVDTTYDLSGKAVEFPLQTQALALSQSKCPPVSAPGHGVWTIHVRPQNKLYTTRVRFGNVYKEIVIRVIYL